MNRKTKSIIILSTSVVMTLVILGVGALLIFSGKPVATTAYAQIPAEAGQAISIPPQLAPDILRQEDLTIIKQNGETVVINTEIAVTRAELTKGLMFRESMPEDAGMLFVFPNERIISFWMKNTLIPLDMIFINASGEIVHIHENAIPLDLSSHPSIHPAIAVLEVNGGTTARQNIKAGDKVSHKAFPQN